MLNQSACVRRIDIRCKDMGQTVSDAADRSDVKLKRADRFAMGDNDWEYDPADVDDLADRGEYARKASLCNVLRAEVENAGLRIVSINPAVNQIEVMVPSGMSVALTIRILQLIIRVSLLQSGCRLDKFVPQCRGDRVEVRFDYQMPES